MDVVACGGGGVDGDRDVGEGGGEERGEEGCLSEGKGGGAGADVEGSLRGSGGVGGRVSC